MNAAETTEARLPRVAYVEFHAHSMFGFRVFERVARTRWELVKVFWIYWRLLK
jgi:hypothetical protein